MNRNPITPGEARQLIEIYLDAKDNNRPELMADAFERNAEIRMAVHTQAISFPGHLVGLERITDVLVRDFGRTYEHVYSFCLQTPGVGVAAGSFSCDWVVTMSEKASRRLRVGCGRYDWHFSCTDRWRVRQLDIRIDAMEVLTDSDHIDVWGWTWALERPWTRVSAALALLPKHPQLESVRQALKRDRDRE